MRKEFGDHLSRLKSLARTSGDRIATISRIKAGVAKETDLPGADSQTAFEGRSARFSVRSAPVGAGAGTAGALSFLFSLMKDGARGFSKLTTQDFISMALIVSAWALTGIMKSRNTDNIFLRFVAFLTSSYNGLSPGVLPIIGGMAARSFVLVGLAGTLIPLITGATRGKARAGSSGFSSFSRQLKDIKANDTATLGTVFAGAGIALLLYAFLTVDGSFQNNGVSILALFLTLKTFGNKNSFLSGFLSRAVRGTPLSSQGPGTMMTGLVLGFALSVPVSLMFGGVSRIGYILGALMLIVGVAMSSTAGRKREAGAAV